MEECCTLACSLPGLYSASSLIHSQAHLPWDGTIHSGWDPPMPINNEDSFSQTQPQADLIWAITRLRLPQMTLGFVELRAKAN